MAQGSNFEFVVAAVEPPVVDVRPACLETCAPDVVGDLLAEEAAANYAVGRALGVVPDMTSEVSVRANMTCEGWGSNLAASGGCALRGYCTISPAGGTPEAGEPAGPTGPVSPDPYVV